MSALVAALAREPDFSAPGVADAFDSAPLGAAFLAMGSGALLCNVATGVGPIGPGLPDEAGRRGSCRSFSTLPTKTYRKNRRRGARTPIFPRFFGLRPPGTAKKSGKSPSSAPQT